MGSTQFSIKYRPVHLEDIFGQDAPVRELKQRTKQDNWPGAILIRGPFGTGKTTAAQIIAANANCKHRDENGNACLKCPSCKSIMEEKFDRDTQVLDGSLIGGKDDMSTFLQNVDMPPLYDPRRIMIIEESDQLSKSAINSLHKILEKPRANTLFILLSMTAGGVPASIVSRCQTYNFKKISIKDTMFYLKGILEKEGLWEDKNVPQEFKMSGLAMLAEASQGSLREAVQLLERAIIGKYYTLQELQDNLGILNEDISINFIEDLLSGKGDGVFRKLEEIDIYEFAQLSATIIANAYQYKVAGYIKNEFFEAKTRAIANHKNFKALAEAFEDILKVSKPFLRKSEVIIILSKYLDKAKEIVQPVPIRTRGNL